jgi:DNA-binding MarR family transcriptional regulator
MRDKSRQDELNAAVELMYFGYRAMVAKPDRLLAARGLARAHHRILYFVARLGAPRVQELLRTLSVTKQALSGPLADLYAQRLIAWERDPSDGRVKRLSLTPAGRALEGRLSALQRRQFEAIFAAEGDARERAWRAVAERLAAPELARSGRGTLAGAERTTDSPPRAG